MPYKGNGHEINFPTDSHRNILLIHGSNTYGKTSILRGIRWGLYGKVYDKRNHQYNYLDLLNWTSADENNYEFEVQIKFEDNRNTYVLTRHVSKKSNIDIPKSDNDFITKVFLEKNGSTLSGADIEHEISLIAPEPVSRFFLFDGELLQETKSF
jgi:DNA sulfur modification protein DndD